MLLPLVVSVFVVSEDDGVVVVVDEEDGVDVVVEDDGGVVVVVVDDVDGDELAGGVTTTVSDFGAGGVLTTAGGLLTTVGRSQATRPAAASRLARSREYFILGLSMWENMTACGIVCARIVKVGAITHVFAGSTVAHRQQLPV